MLRRLLVGLSAIALTAPGWACSPPPIRNETGFIRHDVGHLPMNARGVIFQAGLRRPKAEDFRVESAEDRRPLRLHVHALKGGAWYRVEPVGGFRAGARYRFRYLPAHAGDWSYPDQMSVAIDDVSASTAGRYAIELAPRPAHRIVLVPTSSGSCVVPSPAVLQEFSYALPPSLERYREVVAYDASLLIPSKKMAVTFLDGLGEEPMLYESWGYSLGAGFSHDYTMRKNAVVAACRSRWPRARVRGFVYFPEVEERRHPTVPAELDLSRNVDGQCGNLEAVLQTVAELGPERALRTRCRTPFTPVDGPLRSVPIDVWERQLQFFYGMSSTCDLVALAYLWHTAQIVADAQTLRRLGSALKDGLRAGEREHKDAAVRALVYLVGQLPAAGRAASAKALLGPMQDVLVDMLAPADAARRGDITRLLAWSGDLPPALRKKMPASSGPAAQAIHQ